MQAQEVERARVAQDAEEKLMLRRKRGVSRNSRDAYFHGLVFAAYANDEQGIVDNEEKAWLTEIGGLFQLGQAEVERIIAKVGSLGDADKLSLIEECVRGLQNPEAVASFLWEFGEVWRIGGGSQEDLDGFRDDFEKWLSPDLFNGAKSICATTFTPVSKPEAADQSDAVKCEVESSSSSEEREEAPSGLPSLRKIICIVGQRVKVDRVIEFFKGDEVEFENSELIFAAGKGAIKSKDASIRFSKCRLVVDKDNHEPCPDRQDVMYLIRGTGESCPTLEVSSCDFFGGAHRGAISWAGHVKIVNSTFQHFDVGSNSGFYKPGALVYVERGDDKGSLKCDQSVFRDCLMEGYQKILRGPELILSRCVFLECQAESFFEYIHSFDARISECKFKKCKSKSQILISNTGAWRGGRAEDGFFDCCVSDFDYNAQYPCESNATFNVGLPETEYDANWEKLIGVPMREIEAGGTLKAKVGAPGVCGEIQPMSSLFPSVVIRNRRVKIDDVLCIAPDSELIIENSELIFGSKGLLKIMTHRVSIRNAAFTMESGCDTEAQFTPDWFVLAKSICADLKFSGCKFCGDGKRGAVSSDAALMFYDCKFENLGHAQKSLIKAKSVKAIRCRFEDCKGVGMASLIWGEDVVVLRTLIKGCKTEFKMFQWSGAGHSFEVRESKLKDCEVHNNLIGIPAGYRNGFSGPCGFFSCCFVNVKHNGGLTPSNDNLISKQIDMSEEEYDSRF